MAQNSKIQWTDHTFNPWIGCTKVSPGCAHCYAEQLMATRYGRVEWGAGKPRVRTSTANWREPLRWNRAAGERAQLFGNISWARRALDATTHRPRVFCASLADWLDYEVPTAWRVDLFALIEATPHLDWLLLTKRPESWSARLHEAMGAGSALAHAWLNGHAPANVWVGTTAEDQARVNERVPELRRIPAVVRFLSCEPLLEQIDLFNRHTWGPEVNNADPREAGQPWLDWVICGGESGPGARPMLIEWADHLRRQCQESRLPFFMKQLGAHVGTTNANAHDWPEHVEFEEVAGTPQFAGARVILSDKKGGAFEEFPSELQVRQFPEAVS